MGWRTLGRLFSGVFTLFFIASSVFIPLGEPSGSQTAKPLRILYIVLGALLVLAGILVLLSLPGSGGPLRQRTIGSWDVRSWAVVRCCTAPWARKNKA